MDQISIRRPLKNTRRKVTEKNYKKKDSEIWAVTEKYKPASIVLTVEVPSLPSAA